jgi:hypothetical protein
MSQRLGMADGRCFSINSSSQLVNNYIMQQANIRMEDNYSYRQFLQSNGPVILNNLQEKVQGKGPCMSCDQPMLNLRDMY